MVSERYSPAFAERLPSMVGTRIYGRLGAGAERDRIAKTFQHRLKITSTSQTDGRTTTSTQEEERPLLASSDYTEKLGRQTDPKDPNGYVIRALAYLGEGLLMLDWPVMEVPQRRRSFVPAPWTLPRTSSMPRPAPAPGSMNATSLIEAIAHHVDQGLSR
jgi:hypothetical protein